MHLTFPGWFLVFGRLAGSLFERRLLWNGRRLWKGDQCHVRLFRSIDGRKRRRWQIPEEAHNALPNRSLRAKRWLTLVQTTPLPAEGHDEEARSWESSDSVCDSPANHHTAVNGQATHIPWRAGIRMDSALHRDRDDCRAK